MLFLAARGVPSPGRIPFKRTCQAARGLPEIAVSGPAHGCFLYG